MGIFYEQVEFINRDCIERMVIFDGQRTYLKPNYDKDGNFLTDVHNFLPKIVAPYAVNQNVVMGTEDAIDPSDFDSYVVPLVYTKRPKKAPEDWTPEPKFDISFLPSKQNKEKTRVKLEDILDDEHLKIVPGRGPFKASEAGGFTANRTGIANQFLADE